IAVFSDTKEGHTLIKMLCEQDILVTAFIDKDCKERMLEPNSCLKIMKGRLSRKGIEDVLKKFTLVVDASSPIEPSTGNILRETCKNLSIPLLRMRQKMHSGHGICVYSMMQAVQYLDEHNGNVMLSIGTKDINKFAKITNYQDRVYARIAPRMEELLACNMAGFSGKQIIAMEGPVSAEMTHAQMKEYQVKYLVIKETDVNGDFLQDIEALCQSGEKLIVVKSPSTENGTSVEETLKLAKQFLG
ncbi:MAG: precorrin-6A/cobalt-precorrin-6A reductase, partial [Clostridium sp.]|nr:precorrin-6A/cobalt-precorrin-6A reductase [Clostridium sp.]